MRLNYILSCLTVAVALSQASTDPKRIVHLSKRVVMGLKGFNMGPKRGTTRPTTTVSNPGIEETVVAAESNFFEATSGTSQVTSGTTEATSTTPEITFQTTQNTSEATFEMTNATSEAKNVAMGAPVEAYEIQTAPSQTTKLVSETPNATSGTTELGTSETKPQTPEVTSGMPEKVTARAMKIAIDTPVTVPRIKEVKSRIHKATETTAEVTSGTTSAVSGTTETVFVTTKPISGSTKVVSRNKEEAFKTSQAASRATEVSSDESSIITSRPTSEKTRRMTVTVKSRPTWIGYSSGWKNVQPKWSSYYSLPSARTRPSNSISRTITVTYKPTFISHRSYGANDVRNNIITDKAKPRRSATLTENATDATAVSNESRIVSSETTTDADMSTEAVSVPSVAAGGEAVEPTTDTSTVNTKISEEDKLIDYIDKLGTVVAKPSLRKGTDIMKDRRGKHINNASQKPIIASAVPIEASVVEPDDESITPRILELHRIPKKMQLFEPKVIPADEPSFTVGKSTGFIGVHSVTDKRWIRAVEARELIDLLRREIVNTTNEQSNQKPTPTEQGSLPAAPLKPLIPDEDDESAKKTPLSSKPTHPIKARPTSSSSDEKDLMSNADQLSEIASEVENDQAGRIFNTVNGKNKNIKAHIKPIVAATLPIEAAVVASEEDDIIAILELKNIPKRIRH